MRIASLTSMTITTDGSGNLLEPPVSLLAGGVSGFQHPGEFTVFTRNDATGDWEKSVVAPRGQRGGGEIRHVFDHVDAVTGIHHVFATVAGGKVYRASYDPAAPGRLRWHPEPELEGRLARIMSHVEVNGQLHLAVDITPDAPQNGGLFRRIDGPDPRWEWLGEWGARTQHSGVAWIRGMTAIADPSDTDREVILASRETDGVIERIDVTTSPPARTVEFDFKAHFSDVLGASPGHRIGSIIAYNEMTPATHPDTGEKIRFLTGGAWSFAPGSKWPSDGEALLLLRHGDSTYATLAIPKLADEKSLRSVRTIVASPFPEEAGRTWYLGRIRCRPGTASEHGVDLQGNPAIQHSEGRRMKKSLLRALLANALLLASVSPVTAQAPSLVNRFDRLDRNNDRKLTPQELPRADVFQRLDRNGDGVIEKSELPAAAMAPESPAESAFEARVTEHLDIAYGNHERHRIDLYQPAKAKDAPVMVYVHGGGWRRGDKRAVREKVDFFTGRGWVFVSINYRLLPEGRHPANVNDGGRALAWVHDHAREYGGDPEKTVCHGPLRRRPSRRARRDQRNAAPRGREKPRRSSTESSRSTQTPMTSES